MSHTQRHAHVIVFGNEKGGTGKSTTAVHVLVSLAREGKRVVAIDLDTRQRTLDRYLENRRAYSGRHATVISIPECQVLQGPAGDGRGWLKAAIEALDKEHDFIVVDCPGSDSDVARAAYAQADTLVTPINDSFVDLDLIGHVSPDTYRVDKASHFAETVWESRKERALSGRRSLDWIVMRNRTGSTDAKNKRRMHEALLQLQDRIAFRYVRGLSERVIYRELFPLGLTLADIRDMRGAVRMSLSHVAARHELLGLMDDLKLPGWE
jgi:chromosome partitioning protein